MAKTQNLSLNPTKISGTCGRLMCCLKYEQDAYEDLIRTSPKAESFVDTPEGRGTVVEVDLLRQRVKVKMEDQPEVIAVFANTDIAILRNGKAKKTDPPIPADLAPISGNGKRQRKEKEEDSGRMFLDPIKFRYSTESIVEEEPAVQEEPEQVEEPEQKSSRSRRRNRKPKQPHPEAEKPQQQEKAKAEHKPVKPKAKPAEKPAAPKQAESAAEKPAHHRRGSNHHHRRKPKSSGEAKQNQ